MIIDTHLSESGIATLTLAGALTRASSILSLSEAIAQLNVQGHKALLLDHTKISRINMSGLSALVEMIARHPQSTFGLCALPDKTLAFIKKSGLDRGLHIYDSVEAAALDPRFKRHSLAGTRTVVLCAGQGSRVAPLTNVVPKPMLDIAGRPALHRIMDHLGAFGLKDIILNPGHLGHQIIDYVQSLPLPDHNIMFANEGKWTQGQWSATPMGSASTLKRLQNNHAAFDTDFIVLCGDALTDIDLTDMMCTHRKSGADATIAALHVPTDATEKYGIIETTPTGAVKTFVEKPAPGTTKSTLANSGIYIFSPRVLDLLPDDTGRDIACDLLPRILAAKGKIQTYDVPFSWADIGCGRDYVAASTMSIRGEIPNAPPIGREAHPGVWLEKDAILSPRAVVRGACHIGAGAVIHPNAHIEGTCSIGAGAIIEAGTFLKNCTVLPNTHVMSGAWADNMILHGDWAIDHTRADGRPQNTHALDSIVTVAPQSAIKPKKIA